MRDIARKPVEIPWLLNLSVRSCLNLERTLWLHLRPLAEWFLLKHIQPPNPNPLYQLLQAIKAIPLEQTRKAGYCHNAVTKFTGVLAVVRILFAALRHPGDSPTPWWD